MRSPMPMRGRIIPTSKFVQALMLKTSVTEFTPESLEQEVTADGDYRELGA